MAILKKLTLEEYHNMTDIPSPTMLGHALKSPAHLAYYLSRKFKPTDAYNFGTLIHEFIENKFMLPAGYTEAAEVYQRATANANVGDPKLDEDGDPKFTYTHTNPDMSLTAAYSKRAKAAMAGLLECEEIKPLFQNGNVVVEQSMTGMIDGVEVKCRPDILVEMDDKVVLVEIKTTSNELVDFDGFSRDFFEYHYDLQCYVEREITQQNYKDKPVEVVILAVSSCMPAGCATITIPESLWEIGKARTADALAVWQTKPKKMSYYSEGELELSYKATNYKVKKGL